MPSINAFAHYESIRRRLPQEPLGDHTPIEVNSILDINEQFDTYLFDAFGVLNVGASAIDGAVEHVHKLRNMGKNVMVVSNAASYHKPMMVEKFLRLGYDFTADEIVTSRDALLDGLKDYPNNMHWGIISDNVGQDDLDEMGIRYSHYDADGFKDCDGFLFLSTVRWDADKQASFVRILQERQRPVLLGNPDLIAPMADHTSIEPGSYVLLLEDHLYDHCRVFGKPFNAIYDIAVKQLQKLGKDMDHHRTIMCGDTLHTDILGGNAYGVSTALITGHGFFKGLDAHEYIHKGRITPDYMMTQI